MKMFVQHSLKKLLDQSNMYNNMARGNKNWAFRTDPTMLGFERKTSKRSM